MFRALKAAWRDHRGVVAAVLAAPIALGIGWVATPPRPNWSLVDLGAVSLKFSPDGRLLVTDGASGGALRETSTGRVRAKLSPGAREVTSPTSTGLHHPSFSADSRKFAVEIGGADAQHRPFERPGAHFFSTDRPGLNDAPARLAAWDADSGREIAAFGDIGWVDHRPRHALSADGSTLARAREPEWPKWPDRRILTRAAREPEGPDKSILVWDFRSGKVVADFPGMLPIALSRDGKTLAFADREATWQRVVNLRDTRGQRPGFAIDTAFPGVDIRLALSPNDRLLAIWQGRGNTLELYGAALGTRVATLRVPHELFHVEFSPDSRRLASSDSGHRGETWDLAQLPRRSPVWSSDGSDALSSDGRFHVVRKRIDRYYTFQDPRDVRWDLDVFELPAMRRVSSIRSVGVVAFAIDPEGRTVAVYSQKSVRADPFVRLRNWTMDFSPWSGSQWPEDLTVHEVTLIDTRNGRIRGVIGLPRDLQREVGLRFSPDGNALAIEHARETNVWPQPGILASERTIELWDAFPRRPRWGLAISGLAASLFLALGRRYDVRRGQLSA